MSSYPIEKINKLADALEKLGFIIPDSQADDDSYSIGQMAQLAKKFKSTGLTPEDITKFGQHSNLYGLRGIINGTHKVVPVEKVVATTRGNYLHDLYPGEDIELEPDDGTRRLADAKNVFLDIDSAFNVIKSPKQSAKKVRVYKIVKGGKFIHIFGSPLGASPDEITYEEFVKKYREDLRKICVGQEQIGDFAVKHRDKLSKNGFSTFFLIENEVTGDFFVVNVSFSADKLRVDADWFGRSRVWRAGTLRRVVVPDTTGLKLS